ncbi:hypothetical protein WDA79_14090 [Streptomyces sp. A475]
MPVLLEVLVVLVVLLVLVVLSRTASGAVLVRYSKAPAGAGWEV